MKTSDDLFRLIKSLQPSEKAYFKKYGTGHSSSGKNYVQLFDALDKLDDYDEEQLKKKYRKSPWIKHLPVLKKQLFDLLLKNLQQYRLNQSPNLQLHALLDDVEVLYHKGLYDIGLKQIDKALDIAKTLDLKLEQLLALDWKRRYIGELFAHDWLGENDSMLNESSAILNQQESFNQVSHAYYEILNFIRVEYMARTDEHKEKLEQIFQDPIIQGPEPSDFHSKLYYLYVWNIYFFANRKLKEAKEYMDRIIELWESQPELLAYHPEKYLAALTNQANSLFYLGDFKGIEALVRKIHGMPLNTQRMQALSFENSGMLRFAMVGNYYDIRSSRILAENIYKELEQWKDQINPVRDLIIRFSVSRFYFIMEEFEKSLEIIEEIYEMGEIDLRKDVQVAVHLEYILCQFEIGNDLLLESILRSQSRKLKLEGRFLELETFLFKYLNKLIKLPSSDRQSHFKKMDEELTESLEGNAELKQLFANLLDVQGFIRSRSENRPLVEVLMEGKELVSVPADIESPRASCEAF